MFEEGFGVELFEHAKSNLERVEVAAMEVAPKSEVDQLGGGVLEADGKKEAYIAMKAGQHFCFCLTA